MNTRFATMSGVKTAAQMKKEGKAKRQAAAALRGGAVASKGKVDEVDEVAETVDEAALALKELTTSSASRSVLDRELAAARNVTGRV